MTPNIDNNCNKVAKIFKSEESIRADERKKVLEEVENWFITSTDLFSTMEFEDRWLRFKEEIKGEKE